MIQELGEEVAYDDVVARFQQIFHGAKRHATTAPGGLMLRERWLAGDGLFDRLAARSHAGHLHGAARAGRPTHAATVLRRELFDPVVGVDHVAHAKPHPEGLHKIRAAVEHGKAWYLGDTVDDARASRAAGVPFIGIAAPAAPRHEELTQLLRDEGAVAVLDDINSLEAVLAENR